MSSTKNNIAGLALLALGFVGGIAADGRIINKPDFSMESDGIKATFSLEDKSVYSRNDNLLWDLDTEFQGRVYDFGSVIYAPLPLKMLFTPGYNEYVMKKRVISSMVLRGLLKEIPLLNNQEPKIEESF